MSTKPKLQHGGARPGAGRPKELKARTTRSVVFDAATFAAVKRYAKAHRLTFSAAVRALVTAATIALLALLPSACGTVDDALCADNPIACACCECFADWLCVTDTAVCVEDGGATVSDFCWAVCQQSCSGS